MKSRITFLCITLGLLWSAVAVAAGPAFEFKPYGFVKGEMTYVSNGVLSFGKSNLSGPQMADTLKAHSFGVSSQSTRLGFKGWATTEEGLEIGGRLEIDLFTGGGIDNSAKPRLRLAYAWFTNRLFDVRIGQQWDLFSNNNPTISTGSSALYYAGNLCTRRGQFQFNFYVPENTTAPIISVALCEGAKETDGLGPDNMSGFPMVQARASVELKKRYQFGLATVHAEFDPSQVATNDEYKTDGYSFDYNLRFHDYFAVRGEFNTGKNLANGNFYTIAGNGKKGDTRGTAAFWTNITSKPLKHLNFSVGLGMDRNTSDKISTGAAQRNMVYYGDVIVPIMYGFSLETEIGQIRTWYKGADTQNSMLLNFAGKLEF